MRRTKVNREPQIRMGNPIAEVLPSNTEVLGVPTVDATTEGRDANKIRPPLLYFNDNRNKSADCKR